MAYAGSRLSAASFRSVGIEASVAPTSDAQTLELGGLHTSGEECFPHKVTVGDFLKVCAAPGFRPERAAFLMPTAHGPCRFGQYAPYLRRLLDEMGYGEAMIVSPTSEDGYSGFGEQARDLIPSMWLAVVVGDILQKLLLKTRPYETHPGDTDAVFEESISQCERLLSTPGFKRAERVARMVEQITRTRDRFRAIPARYEKGRPLIGLVGEIFCRLHTFSNDDVARRIERLGGECWLSDIAEWIWYTNWYSEKHLVRTRGRFNKKWAVMKIKTAMQRRYEHLMLAPLAEDFRGYEEPHDIREVLEASEPYLPPEGSIGEMVLSCGKTIYLHGKGADGIIDVSPFTCMNGIICEAVYPSLSRALDELPIRVCYFDGVNTNLDRDLEIFLDLARSYQKRKRHARVYPACFR
jgi:predicted nucleotide-binding protein (sugar kinase/HSP70/actin superfamily)